jgi:hypothetical protein
MLLQQLLLFDQLLIPLFFLCRLPRLAVMGEP